MKHRVWIVFVVLGLMWGTTFLFVKIAVDELAPLTLISVRLAIGTAGLWLVAWRNKVQFPRTLRPWLLLIFMGLIKNTIPFAILTWGQQFIDTGKGNYRLLIANDDAKHRYRPIDVLDL